MRLVIIDVISQTGIHTDDERIHISEEDVHEDKDTAEEDEQSQRVGE